MAQSIDKQSITAANFHIISKLNTYGLSSLIEELKLKSDRFVNVQICYDGTKSWFEFNTEKNGRYDVWHTSSQVIEWVEHIRHLRGWLIN